MTDARLEPLSAFVDGEDVDLGEVVRLLGEPEAVELLRDMLHLRLLARGTGPQMERRTPGREPAAAARAMPARWRWSVAAALLAGLVGLGVGAVVPRDGVPDDEVPPRPDRTIMFTAGVDWVAGR